MAACSKGWFFSGVTCLMTSSTTTHTNLQLTHILKLETQTTLNKTKLFSTTSTVVHPLSFLQRATSWKMFLFFKTSHGIIFDCRLIVSADRPAHQRQPGRHPPLHGLSAGEVEHSRFWMNSVKLGNTRKPGK